MEAKHGFHICQFGQMSNRFSDLILHTTTFGKELWFFCLSEFWLKDSKRYVSLNTMHYYPSLVSGIGTLE